MGVTRMMSDHERYAGIAIEEAGLVRRGRSSPSARSSSVERFAAMVDGM
jgi:hypothetical protein